MLTVDYHDENLVVRRLCGTTGEEQVLKVPTDAAAMGRLLSQSREMIGPEGRVIWIMESTTGWARVKRLLRKKASFVLCNGLEMPLPPKGRRKKTDKIDTGRIQREALSGTLPQAYQPSYGLRQLRRLVSLREDLVSRRTAIRNWIGRFLAHETWEDRKNLWSVRGMARLEQLVLPRLDRKVLDMKLAELNFLAPQIESIEEELTRICGHWPTAQYLDAIRGLGPISAVSILARIGEIRRFKKDDQLIGFAGLAPSVRSSDGPAQMGRIGGGGTDTQLRHYLIEASVWACQIPRYRKRYERIAGKRGNKIGRIAVARMMLRSIYKMLTTGVAFNQLPESTGV
jgi:transposase